MMEPLCYRPWEIAQLTDRQIALIVESAKRQSDELKQQSGQEPDHGETRAETISEDEYVRVKSCFPGVTEDMARAEWRRQNGR